MNRRTFFSWLSGAVAAICGIKSKPKWEACGLDKDGKIKPIDQLSFTTYGHGKWQKNEGQMATFVYDPQPWIADWKKMADVLPPLGVMLLVIREDGSTCPAMITRVDAFGIYWISMLSQFPVKSEFNDVTHWAEFRGPIAAKSDQSPDWNSANWRPVKIKCP